jgi:hypothetical protein
MKTAEVMQYGHPLDTIRHSDLKGTLCHFGFVNILPEFEAALITNTKFHSSLREAPKHDTIFLNIHGLKVCFVFITQHLEVKIELNKLQTIITGKYCACHVCCKSVALSAIKTFPRGTQRVVTIWLSLL